MGWNDLIGEFFSVGSIGMFGSPSAAGCARDAQAWRFQTVRILCIFKMYIIVYACLPYVLYCLDYCDEPRQDARVPLQRSDPLRNRLATRKPHREATATTAARTSRSTSTPTPASFVLTMASSRWKRFAFFDRHTLGVGSDVMLDMIPGQDSGTRPRVSGRETDGDICLSVNTAALPLSSQKSSRQTQPQAPSSSPSASSASLLVAKSGSAAEGSSLSAMWTTLTACSSPQDIGPEGTIELPNQSQLFNGTDQSGMQQTRVKDGLVLVFMASKRSPRVHCVDVTVRCSPRGDSESADEDLDGWRGYWCPLPSAQTSSEENSDASTTGQPDSNTGNSTNTSGKTGTSKVDTMPVSEEPVVGMATCREGVKLLVATVGKSTVVVDMDPHLYLSCQVPLSMSRTKGPKYRLATAWNKAQHGHCSCVDIEPGYVVVGSDTGFVLIYSSRGGSLRSFMTIPPTSPGTQVTSVKISLSSSKLAIYVSYDKRADHVSSRGNLGGVCCYDLGKPPSSPSSLPSSPSARYDLDSRHVLSARLTDSIAESSSTRRRADVHFLVARSDGLYTYSHTQKTAVSPIDGAKIAICAVPTPPGSKTDAAGSAVGSSYSLVASTDAKSGR